MKKGFTLIELLAVIVILAVIAVIATPIIIGVINDSKEKSYTIESDNVANALINKMGRDDSFQLEPSYTSEEIKSLLGMNIKGTEVLVTLINGVPYISMVKDGKSYPSNDIKVYGLSYNGTSTYTRLMDAKGLIANVGVDNSIVQNDFDKAQIYSEMKDVIEDGNYFVRIPKFYIKKVVSGNNWEWYISKIKVDNNYYLPACFMDETNNKELDYILVSKYEAALESDKLVSKPSTTPIVSTNIHNLRTYALNNEASGYQLFDIHVMDVLQTLFFIEFGTLNSQNIMVGFSSGQNPWDAGHKVVSKTENTITITSGQGASYKVGQLFDVATGGAARNVATNLKITNISGDTLTYVTTSGTTGNTGSIAANNIIYNVANLSGQTDSVIATSGSIVSNTNGEYSMKYRGIENLYGNIFKYIDGINLDNETSKIYVNTNAETYTSDVISGDYKQISYNKLNTDGWVTKMGYDSTYPFIQLPVAVGGDSTTHYGDYYYQNAGAEKKVLLYGGSWNHWGAAGINYCYLLNNSYSIDLTFGTRIVKVGK